MSLNGNNVPTSGGGNRVQQENLAPGAQPARVAQVIDLGVQPQRPYQGQEKPPIHMIYMTYELSHVFMKDEEGNELADKPRWISEDMPFHSLKADRARSTKRYRAIDPTESKGGDFTLLPSMACQVVIVNNPGKGKNVGKVFDNIADVTAAPNMPGYVQPELVNPPRVFVLDDPDMDVFTALPEWLQDKIKANLEYKGSKLQALLEGSTDAPEPAEDAPVPEDNNDNPY